MTSDVPDLYGMGTEVILSPFLVCFGFLLDHVARAVPSSLYVEVGCLTAGFPARALLQILSIRLDSDEMSVRLVITMCTRTKYLQKEEPRNMRCKQTRLHRGV